MWWQAPSVTYHSVIQPSLTVTAEYETRCFTDTFWNTRNVSHNNNKHKNSATKFPGDFANFQKISRISKRKNNSSRFPGVLDTLYFKITITKNEVGMQQVNSVKIDTPKASRGREGVCLALSQAKDGSDDQDDPNKHGSDKSHYEMLDTVLDKQY